MKRVFSLVIAVLLIVSTISVCAESADTTVITIEENDNLHVKIKVATTVNTDRFTIKIHGAENELDKDTYLKQRKLPDTTEEGVNIYNFNFNAIKGAKSGMYMITCSTDQNNPVRFRLRTDADKKALYDALNGVSSVGVAGVLNAHKDVIPDGLSGYVQLGTTPEGEALRVELCEKIAGETYEVPEDLSNLDLIDEKFCTLYSENIILSNLLCEETAAEWKNYVRDAIDNMAFDSKYYQDLDADALFGNFVQLKGTALDKTEIIEAFDRATMHTAVNSFNSQLAKEVIEHFGEKGTSGLVFTDYNSLNDNDKITVCDTVKAEPRETFLELKETFEEKAKELKDNNSASQGGSGSAGSDIFGGGSSGGGFGGGSSGGGIITGGSNREESKEEKPQTAVVTFNDIDAYDWAKESIVYLAQKGVLNGRGNNEFDPGASVTKEEFVKIIIEASAFNMENAKVDFDDVTKDRWSYTYIASAYKLGIITGESETYFGASTNITRQDMAVILERVLKIAGIKNNSEKSDFSDYETVSDYAKSAVDMLSDLGIINGMGDGTFAPKQPVTRAQAAKVVFEVLGLLE